MDTLAPITSEPGPRHRRAGGRRTRRMAGRRQAARRQARRMLLRRVGGVLGVVVALVAVIGLGLWLWPESEGAPTEGATEEPVAALPDTQATLLLIRVEPGRDPAAGLTLLVTSTTGRAAAVFIPATTLVEIPGVGADRLGFAYKYGGAELVRATVENELGFEVDGVATVDRNGLASLLQRAGGAEILIEERLISRAPDGTGTVAFDLGQQYLSGARLAEYWAFQQRGESELETYPRQEAVLDAFLAAMADETLRDSMFTAVPPELVTEVEPAVLQALIGDLAAAQAAGTMEYHLLPVAPFGTADEALGASYEIRHDEAAELIARLLPGAVTAGGGSDALPIQVLNGVGVPGVGRRVDQALEGLPFRIVVSENARTFDYPQTQIIIYDESAAMVAAAQQVQQAMGVGTVLVSRQPQSVVAMTIVVGADFLGSAPVPGGL